MSQSNDFPQSSGVSPESDASYTGDTMRDKARDKAQSMKASANETAQGLKARAANKATELKNRAAEMADERKREVAQRIGGYSSALRDAGRSVEGEDPNIAWLSSQAADRLQAVADYVRQRDFQGLRVDAENFARRHPAVLFGGMFVAGLLVGSVLRAGKSALDEDQQASDWDYNYDPETSPGEPMTSSAPITPESSEI